MSLYKSSASNLPKIIVTADHITISDKSLVGEISNARVMAIHRQCPTTEAEYYCASQQALYWYYQHILKCEYNAAVHRRINIWAYML